MGESSTTWGRIMVITCNTLRGCAQPMELIVSFGIALLLAFECRYAPVQRPCPIYGNPWASLLGGFSSFHAGLNPSEIFPISRLEYRIWSDFVLLLC